MIREIKSDDKIDFIKSQLEKVNQYHWVSIAKENNWQVASGETKKVFIIKDFDFVIKFPTNKYEIDYCQREVEVYSIAKYYKVEKILLETSFFFENSQGIKFYLQKKMNESFADMDFEKRKRLSQKIPNIDKNMNVIQSKMPITINYTWLAKVKQIYGKIFVRNFIKWIEDTGTNDLHNGNVCFIKKLPYILDYSGYFD